MEDASNLWSGWMCEKFSWRKLWYRWNQKSTICEQTNFNTDWTPPMVQAPFVSLPIVKDLLSVFTAYPTTSNIVIPNCMETVSVSIKELFWRFFKNLNLFSRVSMAFRMVVHSREFHLCGISGSRVAVIAYTLTYCVECFSQERAYCPEKEFYVSLADWLPHKLHRSCRGPRSFGETSPWKHYARILLSFVLISEDSPLHLVSSICLQSCIFLYEDVWHCWMSPRPSLAQT